MAVGVATIGERVLRRLGVAVVPVANRPPLGITIPVATIAAQALQALGVVVSEANRPALTTVVPVATIATNALLWLAVIAADETPAPLDQALAVSKVQAVHDGLVAQAAVSWASSAIPQAVSEEYTLLTAMHLAPSFGKAADPAQLPVFEGRVRKVALVMQAQSLAVAKVNAVHDGLVSQAFVSWTAGAIPQAMLDEYVLLTVAQLAPLFGEKADLATVPPVEARVRKYQIVLDAPDAANNAVMDIHNDLVMRGIARWTSWDIPESAADAMERLAANQMAPLFSVQGDDKDAALAERQLLRMVSLPSSGETTPALYF